MVAYIYTLVDPRSGLPRYVGLTKHPAARLRQHCALKRSSGRTPLERWIKRLDRDGLAPKMELLESWPLIGGYSVAAWLREVDARWAERWHIWQIVAKGGHVLNLQPHLYDTRDDRAAWKASERVLQNEAA